MQLTLFGGFRLVDDSGSDLDLRTRKTRALLIWLALHHDIPQPRERLAGLLWEESSDVHARHSLRQALSGLRRVLGDQGRTLIADQENIALDGSRFQVDALLFDRLLAAGSVEEETLEQAVSLYGGEFLEGFNPRSHGFEDWLMAQRSHYRERALNAMNALLRRHLECGQYEAGVRLAIRLLGADPLQEPVHRTLMQLYARLNRPAEALRQYRFCSRVLFRELGLEPEPETVRLYRELARWRSRGGETNVREGERLPPAISGPSPLGRGERAPAAKELRPVIVMHLHGSPALRSMAGGSPECLHRYTRELVQTVNDLAGKYAGQLHYQHAGTFVVIFGLWLARGNEGDRALQMALQLQRECLDRTGGPGVSSIQCGIASGSVVRDDGGSVSGEVFSEAEQLARNGAVGEIRLSDAAFRGLRQSVRAIRTDDSSWRLDGVSQLPDSGQASTSFIGRRRELRQFGAALQATIEDRVGETLMVRGEAGIGKTRLVEECARLAEQSGVAVHRTLVLDFGTESQAQPIPDLLRQLLGLTADARAEEIRLQAENRLGDRWKQNLHPQALHWLFRLPSAGRFTQPLGEEARQTGSRELLHGILETACCDKPRLLVVEDIHWADRYTLGLLAELAAAVSRMAALLILTSRVEGEPLDPAWRSAMHGAPLTTLELPLLGNEQARQLARQLEVEDAGFVQRCIERSGGNPFFLEQLLWRGNASDYLIPESIQSLVVNRLDMLTVQDRSAVQAASVLGQRFRPEVLEWMSDGTGFQVHALLAQRLIRPDGEGFLFVHALLREGVYASLLPSRRQALHRKAAQWYRDREPPLYARHLDLAGDGDAAEAYLQAATGAMSELDFQQSLRLATRGIEIVSDRALQARLQNLQGELLIQSGAIDAANLAYKDAADVARDDSDRCRALIGLAAGLTVRDRLEEALDALERAAPLAMGCADRSLQIALHYRRGDILFALGRADECLVAHQCAERLARKSKQPVLEIRALAGLADAYYAQGRMQTAGDYFGRCITLARREKRLPQELGNLAMRGLTRFYDGAVEAALNDEFETARLAAEYGNLRAEMAAYMNLSLIYLYTEDIDAGERSARRGLGLARQLGASRFYGDTLASIGEALVIKGRLEEGLQYLERARTAALESVPTHTAAFILGVIARVTPDRARQQQAIAEGQSYLDRGSLSHNYLHFYQNLIEVCLRRGDAEGMCGYARALELYTHAEPLPWSDFYISRGRLLAATLGRVARDDERRQALALLHAADRAGLFVGTPELRALTENL